jgi:hypothetical protein
LPANEHVNIDYQSQKGEMPRGPLKDGWINKMKYMFAMNYQTLKINEILTHEIIGRSLKKYGK